MPIAEGFLVPDDDSQWLPGQEQGKQPRASASPAEARICGWATLPPQPLPAQAGSCFPNLDFADGTSVIPLGVNCCWRTCCASPFNEELEDQRKAAPTPGGTDATNTLQAGAWVATLRPQGQAPT